MGQEITTFVITPSRSFGVSPAGNHMRESAGEYEAQLSGLEGQPLNSRMEAFRMAGRQFKSDPRYQPGWVRFSEQEPIAER